MNAPKKEDPISWRRLAFSAPVVASLVIGLIVTVVTPVALWVSSMGAIERHESALLTINKTLLEIRDDMREGYVSRREDQANWENFGRLNPELKLPARAGR